MKLMKGDGFTGGSVVSTDPQAEYGSTGSAFVWEMFDSIAYDADKFLAMPKKSLERAAAEESVSKASDASHSPDCLPAMTR